MPTIVHPKESLDLDDHLAQMPFPDPLSDDAADRVARLTLHMSLHATRNSVIISPMGRRRWEERSAEERARMRAGVIRVVQALQMLEFITR